MLPCTGKRRSSAPKRASKQHTCRRTLEHRRQSRFHRDLLSALRHSQLPARRRLLSSPLFTSDKTLSVPDSSGSGEDFDDLLPLTTQIHTQTPCPETTRTHRLHSYYSSHIAHTNRKSNKQRHRFISIKPSDQALLLYSTGHSCAVAPQRNPVRYGPPEQFLVFPSCPVLSYCVCIVLYCIALYCVVLYLCPSIGSHSKGPSGLLIFESVHTILLRLHELHCMLAVSGPQSHYTTSPPCRRILGF